MFGKFWFTIFLIFLLKGCGNDGEENLTRSISSSNDVSKDKAPPPPSGLQAQAIDPLYQHSWHLKNTGQRSFSGSPGLIGKDLNVEEVYQQGVFGRGIKIAVSDNGVEISHPDLWFNLLAGESRDYSGSPSTWLSDPYPYTSSSTDAHGTSVSGIISATKNNGLGTHGVAPESQFAGFLFVGAPYSEAKLIDQAQGSFDIFNFSYGRSTCRFSLLPDAYIAQLKFGVENQRNGKGSLYVKAAGNEYIGLRSECNSELEEEYFGNANLENDQSTPYLINVAALDARGMAASYSTPGSSLWISAPGGEYGSSSPAIITTDLQGCTRGISRSNNLTNNFDNGENELNQNCDYTSTMNGTSSAAPAVTGVIALMLEANPELTWREVKHILAATALKVDSTAKSTEHPFQGGYNLPGHTYQYGWLTNAAGYNFHNWYGFGGVDAKRAIDAARNYQTVMGPFQERKVSSGQKSIIIPDYDPTGATDSLFMPEEFVIEAVQLRVSVKHGYASDLGIEIESPSGMKSRLLNINSGIVEANLQDSLMLTNAFYGEQAQGDWVIRVWDGAVEDQGELNSWSLTFFGYYSAQPNNKDQVVTADSQNLSFLGLQSKNAFQDETRKSAQEAPQEFESRTALKKISQNSRGPGVATTKKISAQIQMNLPSDNVPLSELLSWPEIEGQRVEIVYGTKNQVVAISSNVSMLKMNLFDRDQLVKQKEFKIDSLVFQNAIYSSAQSAHVLSFLDKRGDLETWFVDESFQLKKKNQKILLKDLKVNVHLVDSLTGVVVIAANNDFFHTTVFSPNEKEKLVKPVSLFNKKVAKAFLKNGKAHVVLSSQNKSENKIEEWVLSEKLEWILQSETKVEREVEQVMWRDDSLVIATVKGYGIEKDLGTHDIFLKFQEKEKVIDHPGDEKVIFQKKLADESIVIFGHTNGSFLQSNFGEWDLFGIHLNAEGQELQRWHWGRDQKTIQSSKEQKLFYVDLSELPEGDLVRLWYTHDGDLKVMKFYLDERKEGQSL